MIENKLGDRIRLQREKHSISQRQLAKALNVTSQTIGNYEKGDRIPDAIILKKMAVFFSCSSDYLLGLSNAIQPKYSNIVDNIGLSEENINIIRCLVKNYPPPHGASIGGIMSMINSLIAASSFKDLLFHLNKLAFCGNIDFLLLETEKTAEKNINYQQQIQHEKSKEFDFTPDFNIKLEKMSLDDTIESLVHEIRLGRFNTIISNISDEDPMAWKALYGDRFGRPTL